jgi:hypothetical protein
LRELFELVGVKSLRVGGRGGIWQTRMLEAHVPVGCGGSSPLDRTRITRQPLDWGRPREARFVHQTSAFTDWGFRSGEPESQG